MARSRTPGVDYEVGYKRPPRHTQFQRGQSGNPRGRPKQTPAPAPPAGLSEENARILRLLGEEVAMMVEGRARRVTREEAIDRALIEQAMAGDIRAIKLVLERQARAAAEREATKERDGVALTLAIAEALRVHAWARQQGLLGEALGTQVAAEGPAPGGPDWGEDPGEPVGVAEAGDPLADSVADELAHSAPTAVSPRLGQPSAQAGEAPPPAPAGGLVFGNAFLGPQPPRVRPQRRALSSEPLIKNPHPLTRRW